MKKRFCKKFMSLIELVLCSALLLQGCVARPATSRSEASRTSASGMSTASGSGASLSIASSSVVSVPSGAMSEIVSAISGLPSASAGLSHTGASSSKKGGSAVSAALGPTKTVTLSYHRGVNLPTMGFGNVPGALGTDYDFNSESEYKYYAKKGFDIIRVAILWERIQPTLKGSLNAAYLNGLAQNVAWAKKYGMKIIIDVHNYARYNGNLIGSSGVPTADFCDLWVKLSNVFKGNAGVYAYGLMNEPHDMGNSNWDSISQAAVTAIRNNGDKTLLLIPGADAYSGAANWSDVNPKPWISDPSKNIEYEAHCYFDNDSSGTYQRSYTQETYVTDNLPSIGVQRVMNFIDWCNKYDQRGCIGEYGAPNTDSRWMTVMDNFLRVCDQNGLDTTYWAGGDRWGTYPLSCEPKANFTVDALQMATLVKHLPGKAAVKWAVN